MPDAVLVDPLSRRFILADHTWLRHILPGHPEMRAYRALVEQAVSAPLAIWISAASADARVCFGTGPRAGLLIAVVVDVPLGIVKTAYLTRNIKGAMQEWTR